jgi:hypothetical protein
MPKCPCHGTGRVPMDTGELWDALTDAAVSFTVYAKTHAVDIYVFAPGGHVRYSGESLDDALCAALRAVVDDSDG